MGFGEGDDPYVTLGVSRHAQAGEIRRAFRRLALCHHPDRAGRASTSRFQAIAAAYAILSDAVRRAQFDRERRMTDWSVRAHPTGPATGASTRATAAPEPVLTRLTGHISSVAARGAARVRRDGCIELLMTPDEQASGGSASICARVPVTCPTCGGLADRHGFACQRCDGAGVVTAMVQADLSVPAGVREGTLFTVAVDSIGHAPALRFQVVIQRQAPGSGQKKGPE